MTYVMLTLQEGSSGMDIDPFFAWEGLGDKNNLGKVFKIGFEAKKYQFLGFRISILVILASKMAKFNIWNLSLPTTKMR